MASADPYLSLCVFGCSPKLKWQLKHHEEHDKVVDSDHKGESFESKNHIQWNFRGLL